MTEDFAGKVLDAYKTSPLLTGLLILNIVSIGGFGWWEYNRVNAVDAFVKTQIEKQEKLQAQLLDMATRCGPSK